MSELVFLFLYIYLFVFIFCLPGSTLQKAEPDSLSKKTTNSLRGLGMLLIFFAHATETNVNSISFFYYVSAILGVSSCFFVSGYGLYSSYETKPSFFGNFFSRRLSRLLVPYMIVYFGAFIDNMIRGVPISLKRVIYEILTLQIDGLLLWYLKIQLLLYIFFYISFRLVKKYSAQLYMLLLLILLYIVVMRLLGFEYYWYSTCIFFPMGVITARYRGKVLPFLQNRSCTLTAGAFFLMTFAFIYFKGRAGLDFLIDGIYIGSYLIFISGVLRIRPGSFFLQVMGICSMEIYLVHLVLLRNNLWGLFDAKKGYTYWILLLATLVLSIPLYYIDNCLTGRIRREGVPVNVD